MTTDAPILRTLREAAEGLAGVAFLTLVALALGGLVEGFVIPIPSSVLAMAVLTLFFIWNKGVPRFIDTGAGYLFRIFPLLFIPPLVAIVDLMELLKQQWLLLLLIVTLSTFLSIVVAALTYQALQRHMRERD
ncbi:CidA/LrgA family protein [Kordiimonas aestuarii]|uniref:CidA/LrgA family protein n=1 Tax=Kordiimonas aestuarii TaxID=1005925 RepID=UPI0021D1B462|nr:CidA/LrgA family protein [Kordiimonas aestuarii]